jgi:4-hydroxythreonine-4-phosphate dehydrogenase
MLLMSKTLNVIHVTAHCSMRDAWDRITKGRVLGVIRLAHDSLALRGIGWPKVDVAGLNAHCSENGLFGWEGRGRSSPPLKRPRPWAWTSTDRPAGHRVRKGAGRAI